MGKNFTTLLNQYVKRAALPMSRLAHQASLPRQTLFNWLRGVHPRWHSRLPDDLQRLSNALNLTDAEKSLLLQVAGCLPAHVRLYMEATMSKTLPKGWVAAGSHPRQYDMGVDESVRCNDKSSGYLKSKVTPTEGYGTLMQQFKADNYLGMRLRLSAWISTKNVEERAGLWMRVDAPGVMGLALDNMADRPIKGTTDWSHYTVVLDVPPESTAVAFGISLDGTGQVWVADAQIEPVGLDVPTTDGEKLPDHPLNLDFSE